MKKTTLFVLFPLIIAMPVYGEDAVIQLAPNSSFVVKDSSGTQQLLTVNQNGKLLVNGRDADFTPPVTQVTAPEIATQYEMPYSISATDNTGLAYFIRSGNLSALPMGTLPSAGAFPPHVTSNKITGKIGVPLNSDPVIRTYTIVDTSGNSTTAEIQINSPKTVLIPGEYNIVGTVTIPVGFDCEYPWDPLDGKIFNALTARPMDYNYGTFDYWTQDLGYWVYFYMSSPSGAQINISSQPQSFGVYDYTGSTFLLSATSFFIESISSYTSGCCPSYNLLVGYGGTFTITSSSPPTISASVYMRCNKDNAGWTNGVPVNFTAVMSP